MDYEFLSKTMLFSGDSPEEIKTMLDCLGAAKKRYAKSEVIYHAGETVSSMGIVLSGSVQIENDDLWGHHSVLDSIPPGFVFAETYASLGDEPLMVTVTATRDTEVLFLNVKRLLKTCPNSCAHHSKFIQRLFMVSAQKNLNLSRRIFHTTPKSIRGRLLSYLSFQASAQGSLDFTIPFNRQQLADYLNVERSALSGELGKMQREGLLKTEKNHFTLYEIR